MASQGKIYKDQIINTFSSQTKAIQDIQSQTEPTVPLASWYCSFPTKNIVQTKLAIQKIGTEDNYFQKDRE
jgi:hypothetical protein